MEFVKLEIKRLSERVERLEESLMSSRKDLADWVPSAYTEEWQATVDKKSEEIQGLRNQNTDLRAELEKYGECLGAIVTVIHKSGLVP